MSGSINNIKLANTPNNCEIRQLAKSQQQEIVSRWAYHQSQPVEDQEEKVVGRTGAKFARLKILGIVVEKVEIDQVMKARLWRYWVEECGRNGSP